MKSLIDKTIKYERQQRFRTRLRNRVLLDIKKHWLSRNDKLTNYSIKQQSLDETEVPITFKLNQDKVKKLKKDKILEFVKVSYSRAYKACMNYRFDKSIIFVKYKLFIKRLYFKNDEFGLGVSFLFDYYFLNYSRLWEFSYVNFYELFYYLDPIFYMFERYKNRWFNKKFKKYYFFLPNFQLFCQAVLFSVSQLIKIGFSYNFYLYFLNFVKDWFYFKRLTPFNKVVQNLSTAKISTLNINQKRIIRNYNRLFFSISKRLKLKKKLSYLIKNKKKNKYERARIFYGRLKNPHYYYFHKIRRFRVKDKQRLKFKKYRTKTRKKLSIKKNLLKNLKPQSQALQFFYDNDINVKSVTYYKATSNLSYFDYDDMLVRSVKKKFNTFKSGKKKLRKYKYRTPRRIKRIKRKTVLRKKIRQKKNIGIARSWTKNNYSYFSSTSYNLKKFTPNLEMFSDSSLYFSYDSSYNYAAFLSKNNNSDFFWDEWESNFIDQQNGMAADVFDDIYPEELGLERVGIRVAPHFHSGNLTKQSTDEFSYRPSWRTKNDMRKNIHMGDSRIHFSLKDDGALPRPANWFTIDPRRNLDFQYRRKKYMRKRDKRNMKFQQFVEPFWNSVNIDDQLTSFVSFNTKNKLVTSESDDSDYLEELVDFADGPAQNYATDVPSELDHNESEDADRTFYNESFGFSKFYDTNVLFDWYSLSRFNSKFGNHNSGYLRQWYSDPLNKDKLFQTAYRHLYFSPLDYSTLSKQDVFNNVNISSPFIAFPGNRNDHSRRHVLIAEQSWNTRLLKSFLKYEKFFNFSEEVTFLNPNSFSTIEDYDVLTQDNQFWRRFNAILPSRKILDMQFLYNRFNYPFVAKSNKTKHEKAFFYQNSSYLYNDKHSSNYIYFKPATDVNIPNTGILFSLFFLLVLTFSTIVIHNPIAEYYEFYFNKNSVDRDIDNFSTFLYSGYGQFYFDIYLDKHEKPRLYRNGLMYLHNIVQPYFNRYATANHFGLTHQNNVFDYQYTSTLQKQKPNLFAIRFDIRSQLIEVQEPDYNPKFAKLSSNERKNNMYNFFFLPKTRPHDSFYPIKTSRVLQAADKDYSDYASNFTLYNFISRELDFFNFEISAKGLSQLNISVPLLTDADYVLKTPFLKRSFSTPSHLWFTGVNDYDKFTTDKTLYETRDLIVKKRDKHKFNILKIFIKDYLQEHKRLFQKHAQSPTTIITAYRNGFEPTADIATANRIEQVYRRSKVNMLLREWGNTKFIGLKPINLSVELKQKDEININFIERIRPYSNHASTYGAKFYYEKLFHTFWNWLLSLNPVGYWNIWGVPDDFAYEYEYMDEYEDVLQYKFLNKNDWRANSFKLSKGLNMNKYNVEYLDLDEYIFNHPLEPEDPDNPTVEEQIDALSHKFGYLPERIVEKQGADIVYNIETNHTRYKEKEVDYPIDLLSDLNDLGRSFRFRGIKQGRKFGIVNQNLYKLSALYFKTYARQYIHGSIPPYYLDPWELQTFFPYDERPLLSKYDTFPSVYPRENLARIYERNDLYKTYSYLDDSGYTHFPTNKTSRYDYVRHRKSPKIYGYLKDVYEYLDSKGSTYSLRIKRNTFPNSVNYVNSLFSVSIDSKQYVRYLVLLNHLAGYNHIFATPASTYSAYMVDSASMVSPTGLTQTLFHSPVFYTNNFLLSYPNLWETHNNTNWLNSLQISLKTTETEHTPSYLNKGKIQIFLIWYGEFVEPTLYYYYKRFLCLFNISFSKFFFLFIAFFYLVDTRYLINFYFLKRLSPKNYRRHTSSSFNNTALQGVDNINTNIFSNYIPKIDKLFKNVQSNNSDYKLLTPELPFTPSRLNALGKPHLRRNRKFVLNNLLLRSKPINVFMLSNKDITKNTFINKDLSVLTKINYSFLWNLPVFNKNINKYSARNNSKHKKYTKLFSSLTVSNYVDNNKLHYRKDSINYMRSTVSNFSSAFLAEKNSLRQDLNVNSFRKINKNNLSLKNPRIDGEYPDAELDEDLESDDEENRATVYSGIFEVRRFFNSNDISFFNGIFSGRKKLKKINSFTIFKKEKDERVKDRLNLQRKTYKPLMYINYNTRKQPLAPFSRNENLRMYRYTDRMLRRKRRFNWSLFRLSERSSTFLSNTVNPVFINKLTRKLKRNQHKDDILSVSIPWYNEFPSYIEKVLYDVDAFNLKFMSRDTSYSLQKDLDNLEENGYTTELDDSEEDYDYEDYEDDFDESFHSVYKDVDTGESIETLFEEIVLKLSTNSSLCSVTINSLMFNDIKNRQPVVTTDSLSQILIVNNLSGYKNYRSLSHNSYEMTVPIFQGVLEDELTDNYYFSLTSHGLDNIFLSLVLTPFSLPLFFKRLELYFNDYGIQHSYSTSKKRYLKAHGEVDARRPRKRFKLLSLVEANKDTIASARLSRRSSDNSRNVLTNHYNPRNNADLFQLYDNVATDFLYKNTYSQVAESYFVLGTEHNISKQTDYTKDYHEDSDDYFYQLPDYSGVYYRWRYLSTIFLKLLKQRPSEFSFTQLLDYEKREFTELYTNNLSAEDLNYNYTDNFLNEWISSWLTSLVCSDYKSLLHVAEEYGLMNYDEDDDDPTAPDDEDDELDEHLPEEDDYQDDEDQDEDEDEIEEFDTIPQEPYINLLPEFVLDIALHNISPSDFSLEGQKFSFNPFIPRTVVSEALIVADHFKSSEYTDLKSISVIPSLKYWNIIDNNAALKIYKYFRRPFLSLGASVLSTGVNAELSGLSPRRGEPYSVLPVTEIQDIPLSILYKTEVDILKHRKILKERSDLRTGVLRYDSDLITATDIRDYLLLTRSPLVNGRRYSKFAVFSRGDLPYLNAIRTDEDFAIKDGPFYKSSLKHQADVQIERFVPLRLVVLSSLYYSSFSYQFENNY